VSDDPSGLIRALQRHDRAAWATVVDRHVGELYGFVFHLLGGNRTLAEEMAQETWLEALHGIACCDPARGPFRHWLFGIARRRVALHYRRQAVRGRMVPLGEQAGELGELSDRTLLPPDVVEQIERGSVVRAALLLLPGDRREVLLWKYVDGLSVAAIAARLGRSVKAAELLLARARRQLRDLVRGYVLSCDEVEPEHEGPFDEPVQQTD
jgi:RNA polymerase sigma-70 factor (ECF subfamily)